MSDWKRRKQTGKQKLAVIMAMLMMAALVLTGCSGPERDAESALAAKEGTAKTERQSEAEKERRETLEEDQERGLFILINKEHSVDASYKPDDLVQITKYFAADRDPSNRYLRKEAAEHLNELLEDANAEEDVELRMTTAYRSYEFQKILWDNQVAKRGSEEAANQVSARPGESDHQSGLTTDTTSNDVNGELTEKLADTPSGKWLADNCYKYGFIIRYPKGKEDITGYTFEPWHIRYVGTTAAKEIHDQDLTLEEWLEQEDWILDLQEEELESFDDEKTSNRDASGSRS